MFLSTTLGCWTGGASSGRCPTPVAAIDFATWTPERFTTAIPGFHAELAACDAAISDLLARLAGKPRSPGGPTTAAGWLRR